MKQTKGRLTRDGAEVRRVQVTLDEATIERAKALGNGNLSIGLRKMARGKKMNEYGGADAASLPNAVFMKSGI